ncbi:MAG: hypothetical protein CVU06_14060, partial [Bacteroidetes bacterium HGW-Bacteroidetes-22]
IIININTTLKGFAPALLFFFVFKRLGSGIGRNFSKSIMIQILSKVLPFADKFDIVFSSSNSPFFPFALN